MLSLIHQVLFIVSIAFSLAVGVYVSGKAEMVLGSPWHIFVLFGVAVATHFVIESVVLNKIAFKWQGQVVEASKPVLELTESGACFGYPSEPKEEIVWSSVTKIEILTSDEGPWSEDLWWVIFQEGREAPVSIPKCTKNITLIFKVLETEFSDASMGSILRAMGTTSNTRFLVWQKAHNRIDKNS
ncbi:MAG: hypothetical protein CSB47_05615 [Proteobacteria bacterium]|nr:MAG: hypothetical protein CSB47_05615 [Pseudomonadota bacterium]